MLFTKKALQGMKAQGAIDDASFSLQPGQKDGFSTFSSAQEAAQTKKCFIHYTGRALARYRPSVKAMEAKFSVWHPAA